MFLKSWNTESKILIGLGLGLLALGVFWQVIGKKLHLGQLPGDFVFEKPGFCFYFPLSTSLLLSVFLSFVLFVLSYFKS